MQAKIGAIVQARMSSERLPGKVLHMVAGKPVLQYLLERLEHCNGLDAIVVATSVDDTDSPIVEHCEQHGVACYRGPLNDVAGRFKEVLDKYKFDGFVRVCGDSPLLDQQLIEKGIGIFLGAECEIVTNCLESTYPKGQGVEILKADTFRKGYKLMREDEDFEHVTRFFYNHRQDFKIRNFALTEYLSHITLCVDTRQDMDNFAAIISKMHRPHWEYTLDDILRIYRSLA